MKERMNEDTRSGFLILDCPCIPLPSQSVLQGQLPSLESCNVNEIKSRIEVVDTLPFPLLSIDLYFEVFIICLCVSNVS